MPRTNRPQNKAKVRTQTAANRARAVELAVAGATYQQIADELGYANRGTVHRLVTEALAEQWAEGATDRNQLLHRELARLERMTRALWPDVVQGKPDAIHAALRVADRRAKLLGLDAPTKLQHQVTSELDAEIEQLLLDLGVDPAQVQP